MNLFRLILLLFLLNSFKGISQCNTNTSICTSGQTAPFVFLPPSVNPSSCLDFTNGNGANYGYVILYITSAGPLSLLIDSPTATTGYVDVAIFDITGQSDPCGSLNITTEISCNYATASSGCNQFGTDFPCASSITSPMVNAGDVLMVLVEDWSNSAGTFTLELGSSAGGAETGVGNPAIDAVMQILTNGSSPYQMNAVDNGGVWSGLGITADGLFDPSITGAGNFDVSYTIGVSPCIDSDTYTIVVNSNLAVKLSNFEVHCRRNNAVLFWETLSESNSDYFKVQFSEDGEQFETIGEINSQGNSTTKTEYTFSYDSDFVNGYYKLIEVDFDGLESIYTPSFSSCDVDKFEIYPNPVSDELFVNLKKKDNELMYYEIKTVSGKIVSTDEFLNSIDVYNLSKGMYFIKIYTNNSIYTSKFIRK